MIPSIKIRSKDVKIQVFDVSKYKEADAKETDLACINLYKVLKNEKSLFEFKIFMDQGSSKY